MMAPRYAAVLRRIVTTVLDDVADWAIEARNQPTIERDAGDGCEHALGDTVGRVGTLRITKFRDDVAAANNQAGTAPALGRHRREQFAHVDFLIGEIAP